VFFLLSPFKEPFVDTETLQNILIHGTFRISPLFGAVTSSGATLSSPSADGSEITLPSLTSDSFHPFFSPSSHPLAPISAVTRPPYREDDSPSLLLASGTAFDLSRFAAAVVITDLETGIEGVERALTVGALGCASGMWPRRGVASLSGGKTWSLVRFIPLLTSPASAVDPCLVKLQLASPCSRSDRVLSLQVVDPTPSLTSVRSVLQWDAALVSALPQLDGATDPGRFVAVVEGPKRVGKSTLARTLINALLDRCVRVFFALSILENLRFGFVHRYEAVAYLDTDLGQPEFTPSGFLSLHVLRRPVFGPSFTHLAVPLSSHYLGSPSPANDPSAYLAAAQALLETYALEVEYPLLDEPVSRSASRRRGRFARSDEAAVRENTALRTRIRERVPLVVNTQGWVKGLGADLLAQLKSASHPTHVFSFSSPVSDDSSAFVDSYDSPAMPLHHPYHLLQLPPAPPSPLESKWSAADYRILGLTSYFGAVFPSPSSSADSSLSWNFTHSLVSSAPFPFSWTADDTQVQAVHFTGPGAADGEIKYDHVLHALNGAIVALVATSSSAPRGTRPFPYDPSLPSPTPTSSRALGLALVHSISPSTSTLHLLTPVPSPILAAAAPLTLVKGVLELPTGLMLDYSFGVTDSDREKGVAGAVWEVKDAGIPFLSKEDDVSAVGGRRRVRRNLMRRGQA
jgi:polynucleotide 5'-hydroxyl-kinase GRC3/NOL9